METKALITYGRIWKIAYPIFLTLLVQNLIQVTNTAFLGRVGEVELGASALAGIYYIVTFMLIFGFSTGSQILIGRRNGEGNYHKIGEIVIHGILFLLVMALILFVFTRIFSIRILSKILTSPNILAASEEYLNWRIYGIFFASVNVMFRAFFVGTTRTKVLTMNAILMALANVFFDYVLIFGNLGFPKLGISGAAIASVIAEVISVLFFIIYTTVYVDIKKYGIVGVGMKNLRVIGNILNVSFSLMLQNFISLSCWFLFFLAIEHQGEKSLAVSNVVRSVYMLVAIPVFSLSATANTLVSNAIGAGKKDEVFPLIRKIIRFAWMIAGGFMLIVFLFPRLTLSIYTDEPGLIDASISSLLVVMAIMPVIAASNILFSSVSGTGNTRTALFVEILALFLYIGYTWLTAVFLKLSLELCWTNEFVYSASIFLFSYIYLKRGSWQDKKI